MVDYELYIQSTAWKQKREEFLRYNKGKKKCKCCGRTKRIHVHHLHYKNLGDEQMKDLMYLCEECHMALHSMISRYKRDLRSLRGIIKKFLIKQRKYYKNGRQIPLKQDKNETHTEFKKRLRQEAKERDKKKKEIYSKREENGVVKIRI